MSWFGSTHVLSDPMKPYRRLDTWRVAHELVLAVYSHTSQYPDRERYGLVAQTRRAAVSIAANIAEGAAKRGGREFGRFLDISLGSLSELTYLLDLAHDLTYLDATATKALEELTDRAGLLLWKLYRSVRPAH